MSIKSKWVRYLLLIIAPLILFSPVVLTGKAIFWGTPILQFVPWQTHAWNLIQSGNLPLWNSLVGMGAPLLANYQSGLLYPPNWTLFLLDTIGGVGLAAWGQGLLVVGHIAWASIGMSLLVRRLKLSYLAQVVGGLAFGLSGYIVSRAGFLSINAAVAWMPWILLFSYFEKPVKKFKNLLNNRQTIFLIIVITIQLLAGHAQITWYTLLLMYLWSGFWSWTISQKTLGTNQVNLLEKTKIKNRFLHFVRKSRVVICAWIWLTLIVIFCVGLAAMQLLPTAEYLHNSQRADAVHYEVSVNYSFWPWRLINLFAPDFFGNPADGNYWGYGNYWEDALYIGVLPLIMVVLAIGVVFGNGNKRSNHDNAGLNDNSNKHQNQQIMLLKSGVPVRLLYFLILIIIISILLALGKNTPVFPWLYHNIPTFNVFQAPSRYLIWMEFSIALLAAIGLDEWKRPTGNALYWTRLGTVGAVAVTIGAYSVGYLLPDVEHTFINSTAYAGFLCFFVGVLSIVKPGKRLKSNSEEWDVEGQNLLKKNTWTGLVVVFVAVDLIIAGWGLNPGVSSDIYNKPISNSSLIQKLTKGKRLFIPADDEDTLMYKRFFKFSGFNIDQDWSQLRAVMVPNTNMFDEIQSVNNFDPLLPYRYARWIEMISEDNHQSKKVLLNLMNVGLVETIDNSSDLSVRLNAVEGGSRLRWFSCAVRVNDFNKAMDLIETEKIDLGNKIIIETGENNESLPCTPSDAKARIEIVSENANKIVLLIDADSDGWFMLSDVWYPGWRVYIDGMETSMYPADSLFRAVEVPEGMHTIRFQYDPLSFKYGATISFISIFVLVLLIINVRWKKTV